MKYRCGRKRSRQGRWKGILFYFRVLHSRRESVDLPLRVIIWGILDAQIANTIMQTRRSSHPELDFVGNYSPPAPEIRQRDVITILIVRCNAKPLLDAM